MAQESEMSVEEGWTRREFGKATLAAAAMAATDGGSAVAASGERPNILVFIADDAGYFDDRRVAGKE